jgi:hypothetical protein
MPASRVPIGSSERGRTGAALIGAVGFRLQSSGWRRQSYPGGDTFSGNGTISHRIDRSATYIVKADCTVTEVFADGLTFDGVIVAGGGAKNTSFEQTPERPLLPFTRNSPSITTTRLYRHRGYDRKRGRVPLAAPSGVTVHERAIWQ